jgi:hypothetical protein
MDINSSMEAMGWIPPLAPAYMQLMAAAAQAKSS